ncbi:resolvase [Clostridium estertheticum]|uniref:resolvase n=1 Tax=Clostridium estertheticum TaxID=238834 RepID=UPI001C0BD41B|nr:resolvase [Clostridium estertheticum]MBU3216678.1 resolvase [Clostridium estertheticum]WAG54366.1 resolvase [Clostridium estertheticum]
MKDDNEIFISIVIFVCLVAVRISITKLTDEINCMIMSAINAIALYIVIISIFQKAYAKMEKVHKSIGKDYETHISVNIYMKRYLLRTKIVTLFLTLLVIVYIVYFKNNIINDILTIAALILSIEDDIFVNKLYKWNYRYQ